MIQKMLFLRLANKGESRIVQNLYMESGELQEFVMEAGIQNRIVENPERPGLWIAETSDFGPFDAYPGKCACVKSSEDKAMLIVGAGNIGSRHAYPHLIRHGEVAVSIPFRRQRIGTAIYLAELAQSILEGRREAEDTIVGTNVNMHSFLPFHGYEVIGRLVGRTKGFQDIVLYSQSTLVAFDKLRHALEEKQNEWRIVLKITEKVIRDRERNYEAYRQHGRESLIVAMEEMIHKIVVSRHFVIASNYESEYSHPVSDQT